MSATRAERVAQVAALRAKGLPQSRIAELLGIARSTVGMYESDPSGAKTKARKASYGGACIDCGGLTNGSDGRELAPERCAFCRNLYQQSLKVWTREAVIEAIQRFAAEHGRPPSATEWRDVDHANGYPGFTSVYRNYARSSSPFASWADAIEAAGFPRPRQGQGPTEQWWDRDPIIAACRRWVAEHGKTPSENGWSRAQDGYPSHTSVQYYFGSWNAMIVAAGFAPRKQGETRVRARARAAA